MSDEFERDQSVTPSEPQDRHEAYDADFLALEERIMFDGAMGAEAADAAVDQQDDQSRPGDSTEAESGASDAGEGEQLASAVAAPSASSERSEIYFVDSRVDKRDSLLVSMPEGAEVVVLDGGSGGVEQIQTALEGRSDLDAIHLLSHGEQGRIQLGNTTLNAQSIVGEHAEALTAIGTSLSDNGDILVYGCDFGQDESTLTALSNATGADVAASTDDTGHADLGGDWELEVEQGGIETQPLVAEAWDDVLAQNNTGNWTIPTTDGDTTAFNTTAGVTTTIDLSSEDDNTSFTGNSNDSFNTIPAFTPDVQGAPSLSTSFAWDTDSENGEQASNDAGTGRVTISFSEEVTNPIIHLDRLGGFDDTSGEVHNGAQLTLDTSGVTLSRLSGSDHFAVDSSAGTISNAAVGDATGSGYSSESSMVADDGSAAGSVQVTGTVTSVEFLISAAPGSLEGTGADGIEYGVSFDPSPTANSESVVAIPGASTNVDVLANDSDPDDDPLTVTGIIDPSDPGTTIPLSTGSPVTLATGTTVTLLGDGSLDVQMDPGAPQTETFDYEVSDANGGSDTATLSLQKDTDTDGDGVFDSIDIDDDNDGILDINEQGDVINETSGLTTAFEPMIDAGFADGTYDVGNPGEYQFSTTDASALDGRLDTFDPGTQGSDDGIGLNGPTTGGLTLDYTNPVTDLSFALSEFESDVEEATIDVYDTDGNLLDASNYIAQIGNPIEFLGNNTWAGPTTDSGADDQDLFGQIQFDFGSLSIDRVEVSWDISSGFSLRLIEPVFTAQEVTSGPPDADGDGLDDDVDIDSDDDGITDNVEAQTTAAYVAPSGTAAGITDADGDGLDDNYDQDVGDTSAAASVGLSPVDTDNDGTPDVKDADSDDDGLGDVLERGDGQGSSLAGTDADNDGLDDNFEGADINDGFDVNDENLDATDTNFNLADTDDDVAADGSDATPLTNDFSYRDVNNDPDNDGIVNANDIDDDNDGILDINEQDTSSTSVTTDTDLIEVVNSAGSTTTDIDLSSFGFQVGDTVDISDVVADGDLDASGETFVLDFNDGEFQTAELATGEQNSGTLEPVSPAVNQTINVIDLGGGVAGIRVFTNALSAVDSLDGNPALQHRFTISGQATVYNDRDSDGDGIPDRLDIDSDNDGITDNVEAQTTAGYIAPSGTGSGITDADGDGLDDAYDADTGNASPAASAGLTPVDTDGDGTADVLDADSDNDGQSDIEERNDGQGSSLANADSDIDGLDDNFEGADSNDGFDVNDENIDASGNFALGDADGDTLADGSNADPTATDFDYRDNVADTDGDGVADELDIDDDNDGILDTQEGWALTGENVRPDGSAVPWSGATSSQVTATPGNGLTTQNLASAAFSIFPAGTSANDPRAIDIAFDGNRWSGVEEGSLQINFATPVPADEIVLSLLDADQGSYTGSLSVTGTAGNDDFSVYDTDQQNGSGNDVIGNLMGYDTTTGELTFPETNDSGDNNGLYLVGNSGNLVDSLTLQFQGGTASDGVGIALFSTGQQSRDTDGDGTPDHLDLDSDNDGITDNVEAQTTAGYIAPSGTQGGITDVDGDGLDDNYDADTANTGFTASAGLSPVDTDGDGTADYRDTDSDDDGLSDTDEAGHGVDQATIDASGDTDSDGLQDAVEGTDASDGFDVNDDNLDGSGNFTLADTDDDTAADGADAVPLINDLDYRDANLPPNAVDDSLSVDEDQTLNASIIANDNDPENDPLNIVSASIDTDDDGTQEALTLGSQTSITVGGNTIGSLTLTAAGALSFTPAADYNGTVPTLSYTLSDGNNQTDTADVTVTVNAVDDAVDDTATTDEDTSVTTDVLGNDSFEGTPSVTAVTQPANGTVTNNNDGTVTYTPNADFNGTDSYTYTVTSGGVSETATVDVTVNAVADGVADSFTTPEDTPLSEDVSTNDTHSAAASYSLNTDAANGTVAMNPDGTFTYTPDADYNGSDSFTYDVTDVNGDTETVTVDLSVTPVPDISDDTATTDEDTAVTTDVLDNDSFESPDAEVTAVTQGTNGSVSIDGNGQVTYTPNADFNGTDSYTYTVTSGGVTETATVGVTVNAVADGVADSFTTPEEHCSAMTSRPMTRTAPRRATRSTPMPPTARCR
ncbi:Ig-like domain-containing protein [Halomonas sabkhae]|uniref:Ig-like domain-containing protein n=1 Tax=Halomonas sabkhae TaxID=626223 RepID=UPI0025B5BC45|nr:Ig-like domain-containing protein [Halomonas sabkhae]MDN3524183.1 Ig-like domain-containing protein [Halomonas sabkhae]